MSQSRMAVITFLDGGPVDPGFGGGFPSGGGNYPSQGLPGGPNYPSQGPIYGGGYPSHGLPGGGGSPSHPIVIPPPGSIGQLPVFPWDPTQPIQPPSSGGSPDQGLPGGGESPDQELPGGGGGEKPEQPIQIKPGLKMVVKWLCGVGLILVPEPKK
jgi:hypothetical protein